MGIKIVRDSFRDCTTTIINTLEAKCESGQCVAVEVDNEGACVKDSDCETAGCSGVECVPAGVAKDLFTVCIWEPHYECYRGAKCGCNEGTCNWEETDEFKACVAEKKALSGI